MRPDRIVSPDGQFYLSEEHGYWVPLESSPPAHRPSEPKEDTTGQQEHQESPASRVLALMICGGLALLVLLLSNQVVPEPLNEILALLPVLFVDYVAGMLGSRKFEPPKSIRDIVGKRTWYLSALASAALLVIVADVEGAVLSAVRGTTLVLGLLDILDGIGMGILIGWRPLQRPVLTILGTAFGAALLGGIFDLLVLGQHQFTQVHGGAALIAVVAVSGAVFAVTGLLGYLARRSWRRLHPPGLLVSPDGHNVWDGATWQQVEPDGCSYRDGGRRVTFTSRNR
jgi:hypothetical protein